MKFNIFFNEETGKPEIHIEDETNSGKLEAQLLREFATKAAGEGIVLTQSTNETNLRTIVIALTPLVV